MLDWLRNIISVKVVVVEMCKFCDKCPDCKGDGYRHVYVHEHDIYVRVPCEKCRGFGLVKKVNI